MISFPLFYIFLRLLDDKDSLSHDVNALLRSATRSPHVEAADYVLHVKDEDSSYNSLFFFRAQKYDNIFTT